MINCSVRTENSLGREGQRRGRNTNRGEDELERDGGALGGRARSLGSLKRRSRGFGEPSKSQLLLLRHCVCVLNLTVHVQECVFVSLSHDTPVQTIIAIYMQSRMGTAVWNAVAD